MKKYTVSAEMTISVSTEVEADSAEEAIEIAEGRSVKDLCYGCATGEPEEEWVTGGDLDGTPVNLKAEEG